MYENERYEIRAQLAGFTPKEQKFHDPRNDFEFTFYRSEMVAGIVNADHSHDVNTTSEITIKLPDGTIITFKHSWAITVGISEYEHTSGFVNNLAFAAKDADDFYDLLIRQGWAKDHIYKVTDKGANKRNIGYALETWLRRASPDDLILIYWSSHAWPDPGDPTKAYFACYDSVPSDPSSGMRMDRVRQLVEERKAKNVIIIADTCHSGMIIRAGDPKAIGVIPALEDMKEKQTIPKGWIFIASADSDRKAYEDQAWSNGALTHVLLEGLNGKADGYMSLGNKDNIVTMNELRGYVLDRMNEESLAVLGAKLTPLFYTTTGDSNIWNIALQANTSNSFK